MKKHNLDLGFLTYNRILQTHFWGEQPLHIMSSFTNVFSRKEREKISILSPNTHTNMQQKLKELNSRYYSIENDVKEMMEALTRGKKISFAPIECEGMTAGEAIEYIRDNDTLYSLPQVIICSNNGENFSAFVLNINDGNMIYIDCDSSFVGETDVSNINSSGDMISLMDNIVAGYKIETEN